MRTRRYDLHALAEALEDEIRVAYHRTQAARLAANQEWEPIDQRMFKQWAQEDRYLLLALLSVRREGLRRAR